MMELGKSEIYNSLEYTLRFKTYRSLSLNFNSSDKYLINPFFGDFQIIFVDVSKNKFTECVSISFIGSKS